MKITIRSKLILAISTLMIVVFSLAANLFINEKKAELAEDIYLNTLAFGKLTAPDVAYKYDLYLAQNGFVYFNREISSLFEQNRDIKSIKVISYEGNLLYDSATEKDKQYDGELRKVSDENLLKQVRSENVSLKTGDGNFVFLDAVEDSGLEQGTLVSYFVVPGNEKYSVVYELTYKYLNERIALMISRIVYLAIFAIMLGMILSLLMAGQLTKPVKKLVIGAGEVAKGNLATRVDIRTHDEMKYLGDAFNQMAADLEKSIEAKLYKERVTRELQIAGEIQKRILPEKIPNVEGLDLAAGLIPAEEIGGDIYDFITLKNGRTLMYVGDVTGHGVPAGIVSSIANALFYAYSGEIDLKKLLANVNRVMKEKTMATMFMTLCMMEWDALRKSFRYVNAGHEPLIHYKAKEKRAIMIKDKGMALGMIPDILDKLTLNEIQLSAGDFVVVISDGIAECWRNKSENYGFERLVAAVERAAMNEDAVKIKDAILSSVKSFANGYPQMDDITIMVIRRA
ncbi:MAG: PP2C family protein-serine/threonine phosphatase [Candidatus Gracilibacteria bacterium]